MLALLVLLGQLTYADPLHVVAESTLDDAEPVPCDVGFGTCIGDRGVERLALLSLLERCTARGQASCAVDAYRRLWLDDSLAPDVPRAHALVVVALRAEGRWPELFVVLRQFAEEIEPRGAWATANSDGRPAAAAALLELVMAGVLVQIDGSDPVLIDRDAVAWVRNTRRKWCERGLAAACGNPALRAVPPRTAAGYPPADAR